MKITFLGTSAAEGYPARWCMCPHCTYARTHGGRNIRANCSAIVDDAVLLDLNNATMDQMARFGISPEKVKTALITHPHMDHFLPNALEWRKEVLPADCEGTRPDGSLVFRPAPPMTMVGNAFTQQALRKFFPDTSRFSIDFVCARGGDTLFLDGYRILCLRANHGAPGFCTNYLLEKDGKRLLYAVDSGGYDEGMMARLRREKLDMLVMEGTGGDRDLGTRHMNTSRNIEARRALIGAGIIREDTPVVITHMSPHWTAPHDEYAPRLEELGMICAYDGLTLEI